MARETQLDTHEIDKLLDDENFIDDFDFSDGEDVHFAEVEDSPAESSEDSSDDADLDLDVFVLEDGEDESEAPAEQPDSAAAVELVAELDLDLDNFEFGSDWVARPGSRILQMVVGLVILLWLLQLGGVIYLLRRPVVVRDQIRPLAVETTVQPESEKLAAEGEVGPAVENSQSSDEPDIYVFTSYVKLYSLDGLKVFSVEIELVQYQKKGRLSEAEKVILKESLRQALADSVAGHMREEVVDLSAQLTAIIVPHIEQFFADRGVDPGKIKIRVHNPYIQ